MKSIFVVFAVSMLATLSSAANPFAQVTVEQPRCFAKEYDESHLARHRHQTVKSIRMTLLQLPAGEHGAGTRFLDIDLKLRGKKGAFNATMSCNDEGFCSIDCDGGSAQILEKDGRLVLKNNGFVVTGGCGEENQVAVYLKPTRGNDIFHAGEIEAKSCRAPKWFTDLMSELAN